MLTGLGEIAPNHLSLQSSMPENKERVEAKSSEKDSFDKTMAKELKNEDLSHSQRKRSEEELPDQVPRENLREKPNQSEPEKVTQQAAVLKFMDSMESELGIEPEKMVQAMKTATNKGPMAGEEASPENSMADALASLDLEPKEVERAAELYAEMLVGVGYTGKESIKDMIPVTEMNFQVMTKEQVRKDELASNLNMMKTSFFETAPKKEPIHSLSSQETGFLDKSMDQNIRSESAKSLPDMMNLQNADKAKSSESLELQKFKYGSGDLNNLKENKNASLDSMHDLMTKAKSQPKALGDLEMRQIASQLQSQASGSRTAEGSSGQNQAAGQMSGAGLSGLSMMSQDSAASSFSNEGGFSSDGMFSDGDSQMEAPMTEGESSFTVPTAAGKTAPAGKLGSIAAASNNSSEPVEVQNVQELVDQAQVMVRKGGGTMKVKLNPNGLGEVNLKVDVQNGNVNIQMVADHSEAKRALEKGITELKSHLAQQKLNVEAVNIDVSTELAKDNTDKEAEQDHAREYARDFLGKSRDGNQSFKQDFLGTPFQGYFNQQRESIDPIEPLAQAQSLNSLKRGNSSGRLNLVA